MRLSTRVAALCVGLLVSHQAMAAELPQRWVSAGGALSEWVSALGGESKLVGVDTTSQHPESLKTLPSVGYQRQLSAEGVLSLRPQILVGTEEMGAAIGAFTDSQRGRSGRTVLGPARFADIAGQPAASGQIAGGAEDRASQVFQTYQQQLDQQQARVSQVQLKHKAPGVLLLLGHAGGKPLIAGKDTAADWLLQQAGGHNLATHTGYKPFSVESLASLNPEVLVFADRALTGDAARAALFKENPILSSTRAAKDGRVMELDPTLLVGDWGHGCRKV
ncbi:hemin ABC transporter substrate-binding protein [Pseudomonas lini]